MFKNVGYNGCETVSADEVNERRKNFDYLIYGIVFNLVKPFGKSVSEIRKE